MKTDFFALLAASTTISSLLGKVMAGPMRVESVIERAVGAQAQPVMSYSDHFRTSGLDYTDWVDKMVTEGKMRRPNITTTATSDLNKRLSGFIFIDNVACGLTGGNEADFQKGLQKFTKNCRTYSGLLLWGMETLIDLDTCDGGVNCILIFDAFFQIAGFFTATNINRLAPDAFNAVWADCQGTGGTAQATVTGSDGKTYVGAITAQYYADDAGATCPANTDIFNCQKTSAA